MAGPGGGPPRKSHTKSRKGCKTCKRRHIRCDEHFPQCRNCTKHNCRCDYMDGPPLEEPPKSPKGSDLLWTTTIEKEVNAWQSTGVYPFPELHLTSTQHFLGLSTKDLRLLHHLSSIYRDAKQKDMMESIPWAHELPNFLDIAAGYDFVMNALLAVSATHLAKLAKSADTENLAYHYRGVALNGLHGAIGNFSRENSDPILAASILLSWHAPDWTEWTSLMQGISTVISYMSPWKDSSRFATYAEDHVPFQAPRVTLNSINDAMLGEDDKPLREAVGAMQQLTAFLPKNHRSHHRVQEIIHFIQEVQICSGTMRIEQLFEKLYPLRTWMICMPLAMVQAKEEVSSLDLIVLAHLYAVAYAVDSSIPELGGAAFGTLATGLIAQLDSKLRYGQFASRSQAFTLSRLDDVMLFPCQMSSQQRYQRSVTSRPAEAFPPGQQSPYGFQNLNIDSQPGTPGFPGTFPMYLNHSSEDLSIPPSPFLREYEAPTSTHHSQLGGVSPRPAAGVYEGRSLSGFEYRGESPASYSPAYSPGYYEDDQRFSYGEQPQQQAAGYFGGDPHYDESSSGKGKQRQEH